MGPQLPSLDTDFFSSNAHRIAWYLGTSLLPLSPCKPEGVSEAVAERVVKGQTALHAFFSDLYADMLANPAEYRMETIDDAVFNDGEWYKQRPDMKKTWGKNGHVLKSLGLLFDVVTHAAFDETSLLLDDGTFQKILTSVVPKAISRPKMKAVLTAMGRSGLSVSLDDGIQIICHDNPDCLYALKAMTSHVHEDNYKVRLFGFLRCDFKSVLPDYEPDIDEVFAVLNADQRDAATTILSHLMNHGYGYEFGMGGYPSAMWRIGFTGNKRLKAGEFLTIGFSIEYQHRLSVNLHCINPLHLIPIAQQKGEEYLSWFSDNWLRDCNGCGYCKGRFKEPGPYVIEVGGMKRGLCHQNWMDIRDPDAEQVDSMLRMVDLHSEAGMVKTNR